MASSLRRGTLLGAAAAIPLLLSGVLLSGVLLSGVPARAQGDVVAAANEQTIVSDRATIDDLVAANRILAQQNILDAFGHVSVRDPTDPNRFWLARSGAPGLVGPGDIIAFDLNSAPLNAKGRSVPLERFIHGAIYQARPDVKAIIHTHAPPLIPFGVTSTPLKPLYHMSSFLALGAPVFEIRESGGLATDLLIRTPALGSALAQSLHGAPVVLMRGHGATIVGVSIPQVVFRAVYTVISAQLQAQAQALGPVTYLTGDEAAAASKVNDVALNKAWALWKQQITKP